MSFIVPQTRRPVNGEMLFNVFSGTKAITVTALHPQAERGLVTRLLLLAGV